MKRGLLILAVFLLSFATFSSLASPAVVHAAGLSCPFVPTSTYVGTGPQVLTIVFPPGATGNVVNASAKIISGINTAIPGKTTILTIAFTPGSGSTWLYCLYGGAYVQGGGGPGGSAGSGSSASQPTCPMFFDGRLDNCQPWETSAIYCQADGSVRVYVIGTPDWTIDFDASRAEIAKVSKNPAHNTLIKKGHFASLSRQSNGLLLVSSPGLNPKDGNYTFTFSDCGILVGM